MDLVWMKQAFSQRPWKEIERERRRGGKGRISCHRRWIHRQPNTFCAAAIRKPERAQIAWVQNEVTCVGFQMNGASICRRIRCCPITRALNETVFSTYSFRDHKTVMVSRVYLSSSITHTIVRYAFAYKILHTDIQIKMFTIFARTYWFTHVRRRASKWPNCVRIAKALMTSKKKNIKTADSPMPAMIAWELSRRRYRLWRMQTALSRVSETAEYWETDVRAIGRGHFTTERMQWMRADLK